MNTTRHSFEYALTIIVGIMLAFFITAQRNNRRQPQRVAAVSIPFETTPIPPDPQESIMDSPEGVKTLTMKSQENSKGLTTYTLYVTAKDEPLKNSTFSREEPPGQSLEIPFNTWSVGNDYFFLKEKTSSGIQDLVFRSNGASATVDEEYVSVQKAFKEKLPGYAIEEVTGWADRTYLIVNTTELSKGKKVTFWFDIPSQTFSKLGTYFR
jgi:hypothetical protein